MTDREIMAESPWLLWNEPQPIHARDGVLFACRLCMARHGVEKAERFVTRHAWRVHMRQHPDVRSRRSD